MSLYFLAFFIGVVAGLRSLTAPAAVSWAARLGWIHLEGTWLAFFGFAYTPYVFSALAFIELIVDKLPSTPSRKAPMGFLFRLLMGGLCGAALGVESQGIYSCLAVGVFGAVVGTLGGYEFRVRLVKAIGGRDLPIALLEDALAILVAAWVVFRFS